MVEPAPAAGAPESKGEPEVSVKVGKRFFGLGGRTITVSVTKDGIENTISFKGVRDFQKRLLKFLPRDSGEVPQKIRQSLAHNYSNLGIASPREANRLKKEHQIMDRTLKYLEFFKHDATQEGRNVDRYEYSKNTENDITTYTIKDRCTQKTVTTTDLKSFVEFMKNRKSSVTSGQMEKLNSFAQKEGVL